MFLMYKPLEHVFWPHSLPCMSPKNLKGREHRCNITVACILSAGLTLVNLQDMLIFFFPCLPECFFLACCWCMYYIQYCKAWDSVVRDISVLCLNYRYKLCERVVHPMSGLHLTKKMSSFGYSPNSQRPWMTLIPIHCL